MEGEGFMVGNNYLKCKYVINPNYVLHIYVLSPIDFSNLESNQPATPPHAGQMR